VVCAHRENLPALQEAALAAVTGYSVGGKAPGGLASDGMDTASGATRDATTGDAAIGDAAIGHGAVGTFELPKDWDETLPTAGFWVLNIAPPARPEPGPDTPGPDPVPSAAVVASGRERARTWWQRLRARGLRARGLRARAPRAPRHEGGSADRSTVRQEDSRGDGTGSAAERPVGVLISADRYDLADPSES